jgi:hypothetical protein
MLTLTIALLAGCDADCDDTTRLNQTWAMWHAPLDATGGITADENYPTYQVFSNGWSKWKIAWSQDAANVDVEITDAAERQGNLNTGAPAAQKFSGQLLASEDNCNALVLDLTGEFETTSGTRHAFDYTANLVYYGEHLAGTYTYSDTWTSEDTSGAMSEIHGDVRGTAEDADAGFDTGFTPYEEG